MKLGILLTSSPFTRNVHTALQLARCALELKHEVSIFLMMDGVYNAESGELKELIEKGAEVSLCAHNAIQRGVDRVDKITYGSQVDLASIVRGSDRFIHFG